MSLIIDNGIIKQIEGSETKYLNASEIFSNSFDLEGIKVSKLKTLDFILSLSFLNKKIVLNALAITKDKKVEIQRYANRFADYLINDNIVYFVNPIINDVNEIIKNISIDNISFSEYLRVYKEFSYLNIQIVDGVSSNIGKIQSDITSKEENYKILFDYQKCGVNWLNYMFDSKCGCILADSMGLGKTIQIIFMLFHIKKTINNSTSLIVCPVSLLENWKREIDKFCPSLNYYVNYGNERINYYKDLEQYDVVITSYGSIMSGFSTYQMIQWNSIILDEAQNIKNPYAKRTKIVKMLNKDLGVAVTGTPFENHLTDIWSITDFIMPGYFGSIGSFEKRYEDSISSAMEIERMLTPIMIRRKVEDVADDLPDKVDIPQPIRMSLDEAKYYDAGLKDVKALKTLKLETIQKLRMFCTHPSVYDINYSSVDPITISQKYERCCEILEEIIENKEKAIIFTSFNEMINLLVTDINKRFNVPTDFINGSIEAKERQHKIDQFSSINGAAVMVLNPRAAGAGLNITAANHVIHYNLEWNPSIEDQASARAYRRGQNKTVFVHRLFYIGTIEEVINEKIERKREISDTAVIGNDGNIDEQDLAKVLALSPIAL